MMFVASLELCKELYELSGWNEGTSSSHYENRQLVCPFYDLGYLLWKLPATLDLGKGQVRDLYIAKAPDCYIADYMYRDPKESTKGGGWWHRYDKAKLTEADTPEDAAAKLACELFKQGILTKEAPSL